MATPRIPIHGTWKTLTNARPYVTVSGIAFDSVGNFPLIYRSDHVRSAKNCWSIPSGLHEVGLTLQEQFAEELHEELGLTAIADSGKIVGLYENIALIDQYHWCIVIMTIKVESLTTIKNKEPDKHPVIETVNYRTFNALNRPWAPGLEKALITYWHDIYHNINLTINQAIT